MKKVVYSLLIIATLAATFCVEPARAQSDHLLAVTVPFNFYVKDRALPAGQYTVALVRVAGADALKIQSNDGHLTALVPVRAASTGSKQDKPQLVFRQYEDRYFLAQVTGLEETVAQQVSRSRIEEEVVKSARAAERQKIAVAARKR